MATVHELLNELWFQYNQSLLYDNFQFMQNQSDIKKRSKTMQTPGDQSSFLKKKNNHPGQTVTCSQPIILQPQSDPDSSFAHHQSTIKKENEAQPSCGQFKKMKMMIKSELQKLSYRQKLNNIQGMIFQCKELAQKYGYFSLTCTMFDYNPNNKIKFSIWIHPDKRVFKPLHPISKETQFQSELEFVANMKKILKDMFPTINFGKGKTLANLMYHITNLKKSLILGKRSFGPLETINDRSSQQRSSGGSSLNKLPECNLYTSLKSIPKIDQSNFENMDEEYRLQSMRIQKQNNFKIKTGQKATTSTLVESIRSNNSLRQKLRNKLKQQIPDIPKPKPPKLPKQQIQEIQQIPQRINKKSIIIEEPTKQQNKHKEASNDKTVSVKKSTISTRKSRINRKMYTSGEIENQLNDLFDPQDLEGNAYYTNANGEKSVRNSLLSQVMEQFQDVLF